MNDTIACQLPRCVFNTWKPLLPMGYQGWFVLVLLVAWAVAVIYTRYMVCDSPGNPPEQSTEPEPELEKPAKRKIKGGRR